MKLKNIKVNSSGTGKRILQDVIYMQTHRVENLEVETKVVLGTE